MTPNSFNINSSAQNSMDLWGLKVISHDPFSPPKRRRKTQIPFRNGAYNMGHERYYDDQTLILECQLTKQLSRADFREIVYTLSQRNALFMWNEPDKFYRAELYEQVDVNVFPREIGRNFTLPFICEPFAYGPHLSAKLSEGINDINYIGTAEAPTLIIIRNPNNFSISNITITAIQQIR